VLSALATGHKVGIAVVAGVFIVFALSSAFLLPRLRPQFPGSRVGLFVAASVLLTVGMLSTVIVLAREPKAARGAAGATTPTATTATGTTAAPATPAGAPAAGKALFASQGCSACHTFTPAHATGVVGPNLDHLAADAAKANRGSVVQYATESIKNPGAYVVPGFPNGVMPTTFGSLGAKKIADLVAFLTSGKS
jgi:mono/diheme cytochrome c family protein